MIETINLGALALHGPVEIRILTHVRLPDGRNANLEFQMPPGRIPTRLAMKEVMDACLSPESMAESSIPVGTRLLTKIEFVEMLTKREDGKAITLTGEQPWEPTTVDIPRHMLQHAVIGAGVPKELAGEYVGRGLAYFSQMHGKHVWNDAKLDELPDELLYSLYQRII
jgi:hypothetical protein